MTLRPLHPPRPLRPPRPPLPTTSRPQRLVATPGEESLLEGQLRTLATPPTPESLPRQNLDAPGEPTRPTRTERPLPSPMPTGGLTPGRSDGDKGFPMTPSPHPAAAVRLTKGVRSFISPQLARIWGAGDGDEWKKMNHEPSRARANAPPWMKIRRRRRRYPGGGGARQPPAHTPDRSKSTASQTELRTKPGAQEKDVMGDAKGRRNGGDGNTAIPAKYGGPSEPFPAEMSVADRYEAGREGRRTPIDFKVTKTGDFGGFSVTKTEEVDPINGFSVTRTEVDPARGRVVVTNAGEGQRSSSSGSETSSRRRGLLRRVNPQDKLSPEAKAAASKAEEPPPRLRLRDPRPEASASKRERGKMEDKGGGNHAGGDEAPERKEKPDGKEETPDKTRVPQDDLESKLSRQAGSATVKPSTAERSRSKMQTDLKTQQKTFGSSDVTLRNSERTSLSATNDPLPLPTLRIHSRSSTLYPEANKTKQTQVNAEAEKDVDVDASIFDLPVDEAGPESRLHYQREMPDRGSPPRRPTAAPTRVFPSTTLSSVFSEELIPPLPNQWDDDWRHAGPSRGDKKTERHSDSDDAPPYESGDRQPPDSQKEKQRTTKDQESPKAAGGATSDRTRAEVRPALGKADLRASSWPGPGERVEYVTVVPGGHWDVWGGPTLWDSLTPHSNNSHTNPQVYSVYWGDTGGPGSPPGWPEGVWVIRGGSLLAIMALVVTISVQVARDGPATAPCLGRRRPRPRPPQPARHARDQPRHVPGLGPRPPHLRDPGKGACSVCLARPFGESGGPPRPSQAHIGPGSHTGATGPGKNILIPSKARAVTRPHARTYSKVGTRRHVRHDQERPRVEQSRGIKVPSPPLSLPLLPLPPSPDPVLSRAPFHPSPHPTPQHHDDAFLPQFAAHHLYSPPFSLPVRPPRFPLPVRLSPLPLPVRLPPPFSFVNAGVCVAAQKVLLDTRDGVKHEIMTRHKRDLRGAVALLPLEGISWFLAVVALEDHQSLALDFAAAFVSAALGWLVLYFHGWTWSCHGLCWLRRRLATTRRVDDLSLPLTAATTTTFSSPAAPPAAHARCPHRPPHRHRGPPPPATPAHQTLVPHRRSSPSSPLSRSTSAERSTETVTGRAEVRSRPRRRAPTRVPSDPRPAPDVTVPLKVLS
ncbi:hypothetical protein C7M84_006205 [Penaeus vannamei]|uniref:Uncharacterized protein n=1 Tax=Penaeus vannamei TaxID=6689 RepID=A0A3R7PS53_PENVA|nr:hypothetical protein C7M84_006205 [Penaeus vannamei]